MLAEESEPAVYGYSQTYTVPGTNETRERRGFIALGHLYDYADKVVYRHEQTFPKHKSDRLALFKATRAYCEQIYMLYSDPAFTAEKLIFGANGPDKNFSGMIGPDTAPADLAITDEYNVVHRLWKIADPNTINLLLTAMADKKLIIADGHHRYETSVAYAKERSAQLKLPFKQPIPGDDDSSLRHRRRRHPVHPAHPAFPEAAMMMTFVNMDAPGITILPTHRVVHGLPSFSSPDFVTKASAFFNVKALSSPDLAALNATHGTAFLAATGDGNYLLTPKPDVIAAALKGISPARPNSMSCNSTASSSTSSWASIRTPSPASATSATSARPPKPPLSSPAVKPTSPSSSNPSPSTSSATSPSPATSCPKNPPTSTPNSSAAWPSTPSTNTPDRTESQLALSTAAFC
ncbi:DUF1015 family protein [Tunturiibacter gelidiferens]|uniref:DUF1015 family protein n=1 Tax=Tunturiibacter gelidiferens TaxID=3069689 RepID=UPI003D9ACBAA